MDQVDEGVEALAELQRESKIRYSGVSNFSVNELEHAKRVAPIVANQPPYSVLEREIEKTYFPYCRGTNIGVLIDSPMKSGLTIRQNDA